MNSFFLGFIIAALTSLIYLSSPTYAQVQGSIVINEFSSNNGNDWVELYNPTDDMIDLTSYFITDGASNKKIFTCVLLPQGFISVNWDYLNNDGDIIKLNKNNDVIDCVTYGDGDGNLCTGQTPVDLQKLSPGDFASRENDGGSWKIVTSETKGMSNVGNGKGANSCVTPTPSPTPTPTPIPTATPTTEPSQSYDNIFISEVMVAPNTGEKEWVELYNDNDFSVTLQDWYIDDISDGGSSPKKMNMTLGSKKYTVFELSSAIFNNSGDVVRLLDQDENEKDFFEYSSSEKGKSWGWDKLKSNSFCLQTPSPNTKNNACFQDQISPSSNPSTSTGSNEDDFSISSQTNSSTQQDQTSSPIIYSKYVIPVSPPTLIQKSQDETNNKQVLAAATKTIHHPKKTNNAPLLATGYALLSIGSLVAKMIYS